MLYINDKFITGRKFTVSDPNIEYTCVGYAQNDTSLVVGSHFDSVNNRSSIKTFKLTEARFLGDISVVP